MVKKIKVLKDGKHLFCEQIGKRVFLLGEDGVHSHAIEIEQPYKILKEIKEKEDAQI